jgi:hypothetical protein
MIAARLFKNEETELREEQKTELKNSPTIPGITFKFFMT